MRGFLPKYFSSEWSFAQFRVPETRTICAFGAEKNTIVGALCYAHTLASFLIWTASADALSSHLVVAVVGADGSFYKAVFDANGECQNTSYSKFIQSEEEE